MLGRDRNPTELITAFARQMRGPSGCSVLTTHSAASSSQTIDLTSVSNWMSARTPNVSATQFRYFSFSGCGQYG